MQDRTALNSLEDVVSSATQLPFGYSTTETIAQPWTFALGTQYTPLTLNRTALSYGYMGYGLAQTLIDQPVEDAFRGGIIINAQELSKEDHALLQKTMADMKDIQQIKRTWCWGRLFGGAGLIIDEVGYKPSDDFSVETVQQGTQIDFVDADRWELTLMTPTIGQQSSGNQMQPPPGSYVNPTPYNYYGVPLNRTRVLPVFGRKAPSFIRQRLQGWGMSELERCLRSINSFIKFQNVIFELIDEAKIDVYGITGFNELLASGQGTQQVQRRVQLSTILKSYQNALAMDKEDTYEQKQIAFSGLAEIYQELRLNLSSDLKIPMNKLFGQSAAGFSSGEDSIENYNSIVESDVREPAKSVIEEVVKIRCMQLFGYIPEFTIEFNSLRILNAKEEEELNKIKQQRVLDLFDRSLYTGQEAMDSLDKYGLVNIESEVQKGLREVIQNLEDPSADRELAAQKQTAKDNAIMKWHPKNLKAA